MNTGFAYIPTLWGELIYGSKTELQALGLAVGMAFPGEAGGPRRFLSVRDPRGYETTIAICRHRSGAAFNASIEFPGRSPTDYWRKPEEFYAPGVSKRQCVGADEYRGTAGDLAAAGLLRLEHLPGQAGMRKVRVTIHADGTVAGGVATAFNSRAVEPGARRIERATGGRFLVSVVIPHAESEIRLASELAAMREWERRMAALPRPAALLPVRRSCADARKHPREFVVVPGGAAGALRTSPGGSAGGVHACRPGGRLVLVWDAGAHGVA